MFTVLFLDTRTDKLYNYEQAIEVEKEYVKQEYSFEDWLPEDYNPVELYNFFKRYDTVEEAEEELKSLYRGVLQQIAEENLERPATYDWKTYTVDVDC